MIYLLFFVLGLVVAFLFDRLKVFDGVWMIVQMTKRDSSSASGRTQNDAGAGQGSEAINPSPSTSSGSFVNEAQVEKHKENLGQIVGYMSIQGKATNQELQKLLGVPDATVVRYMNEPEKDGKVEQVGDTGHTVYYKLINR